MFWLASMAAAVAVLLLADVTGVRHWAPPAHERIEFPIDALPVLPVLPSSSEARQPGRAGGLDSPDPGAAGQDPGAAQQTGAQPDSPDTQDSAGRNTKLRPESRLALVRFIGGEFVRAVHPLPAGKKGFRMKAGVPISEKELRMALGSAGAAVNPGDPAQITKLEFKDRVIIVDVNGGGRGKTRLRDRISMDIGGIPTMRASDPVRTVNQAVGSTLYLEFDTPVPDMTPDELKQYLSSMLDFSTRRSAAVQWVETLPAEMQTAIKEKRPEVGMDREMVVAAMGRPDRKVRERRPDGVETEDWIYGKPPSKTIFVRFEGDKVVSIQQFPL